MNFTVWSLFAVLLLADGPDVEKIEVAKAVVEIEDSDGRRTVEIAEESQEAGFLSITSERCDFDRTDGVVLFEDSAKVEYSTAYTMCADRLFVYFCGSNELDRIVCEGNVAFSNDTRVGMCDWAVFRRRAGEIEMRGNGETMARLAERGVDEIAGRRIIFWADAEQVEVEGSELTFERGRGSGNGVSGLGKKLRNKHEKERRKNE